MNNDTLSVEAISGFLDSPNPFPIDFDKAWKWIGWAEKATGKAVLQNNFKEGFDFLGKGTKSPTGGRPRDLILLSIDCFKCLSMMAGTEKGREVRQYFLDCERRIKNQSTSPHCRLKSSSDELQRISEYLLCAHQHVFMVQKALEGSGRPAEASALFRANESLFFLAKELFDIHPALSSLIDIGKL